MGWSGMGNFNIKKVLTYYLLEKSNKKKDLGKLKEKMIKSMG